MTGTNPSNEQNYVPLRITLTEDVDKQLENLANSHHGGNRSEAIRVAIREKVKRPNHHEIRVELKRIIELIEKEFSGSHDDTTSKQEERFGQSPENNLLDNRKSADRGRDPALVGRKLLNYIPEPGEEPVLLRELIDEVDEPLAAVAVGIEKLEERSQIEKINIEGSIAFRRD